MKFIEKILNSLVHRSGILIEVRNLIKKMNIDLDEELFIKNCEKFRKQIIKMSLGVPLKMIGKSNLDGSYPIYIYENMKAIKVISIGVGNNIRFDEEIANLGATVWTFDHTVAPRIKRKFKNKIYYFPYGIKGSKFIPNCKSLSEILNLSNNLDLFDKTILKMDCEGAEWDVFSHNSIKTLAKFDQIIVELHDLEKIGSSKYSKVYLSSLKKLESNFFVSYIAPNNFTPIVQLKNGMNWPFTLEIHFINKNLIKNLNTDQFKPGIIDEIYKTKNHWHLASKVDLSGWYRQTFK